MEHTHTLIIGAGISGLSYANFSEISDLLILEASNEIGGYCKTVKQDGFVWDYSGHFFHFRHPEIEKYLVDRMPKDEVKTIVKSSKILFGDTLIDFPFQKNIHQLPKADLIDCIYHLFFRKTGDVSNFKDMLYGKFGRGICERFLIPYNEKLYACDLSELDADAMGRFFPYAETEDIIRNFKDPDNRSYNETFTYPKGGAVEYVNALKHAVPDEKIALSEKLLQVDLAGKIATTDRRQITYERLISSAPVNQLLAMTGIDHDESCFSSNKVLVFNLGFDKKSWEDVHWVYFPERKYSFYRVGFYDNIFGSDRLSIYVEIGMPTTAKVDSDGALKQVLTDLMTAGVTSDHELVSQHSVVLDPAYVHVNAKAQDELGRVGTILADCDVYSIGRYGGWKYCAIEDNIVEARKLVEDLEGHEVSLG